MGGTFTDLLLIDDDTGATFRAKTPSTPDDPSQGVLTGIGKVTADVDVRRLVAEFNRLADDDARSELLDALFVVAYSEKGADDSEIDEIRRIADFLWIDRRTFNEVRLRHAHED